MTSDNPRAPICPDCGTAVGAEHIIGCDVERCRACGGQRISCGCPSDVQDEAGDRLPWTGEWPGISDCRELGLFCRDLLDGVPVDFTPAFKNRDRIDWHVPCAPEDPGAHEDLNRLYSFPWDPRLGKHVRRVEGIPRG